MMRPLACPAAFALAAALLIGAPALAADTPGSVSATLKDKDGKSAGTVTLSTMGDHLMGRIEASGLTPGEHGMHIHAVGKCDGPDFSSAGGHLNPTGKQHGLENPQGSHEGDLPALKVGADGTAEQSFPAHSSISAILDGDGAAFVVHAGPDDQKTDPSGNSGGRVLCGVFAAS